ncbi:hypothetical protein [Nocardioides sp.]|uniref:hypothetical protein n=1 Tax=Nocardioides sp. TaxID=35761 RepID=UPI00351941FE
MADQRHKRDTNARPLDRLLRARPTTLAGSVAVLATTVVVGAGVTFGGSSTSGEDLDAIVASAAARARVEATGSATEQAGRVVSRSADRGRERAAGDRRAAAPTRLERRIAAMMAPEVKRPVIARAVDTRDPVWTTAALNLWVSPAQDARRTGELPAGEKVVLTGRELAGRVEIVWGSKQTRWVTAGYTSTEKPFTLGGDCTNGTTVPSGVSENIKKVHAAVCAAFPEITTYGTFRGDGEHAQGIAVDIMVSGDRGRQVAEFLRRYYAELGISYLIYQQQIWSVERSGEGWRGMENRGSITANHYDHVHVTVY